MSSFLTYNQYAAQALWGSSSGSGSSSLLNIIKSNMLDKANSLNKKLISKYETQASQLTTKMGYLDNLKSQLATLSTKAQNLTGLKNKVNANINVSSGSSSLVTITNDFIIKGQPAKPAGVASQHPDAIQVGNYEGTFAAGNYTINVQGNAVNAQTSVDFSKIKFNSAKIGEQKISELAGYDNDSDTETVRVVIGGNASTIKIGKDTTVKDFLDELLMLDGIKEVSIDSSRIRIELDTDSEYQDISFTSSNNSGGSVLDILGLNSAMTEISNGIIDTLSFGGFHTNFEEVGMKGNFNLIFKNTGNVYTSTVTTSIDGGKTYGDEITGKSSYNGYTELDTTTIVDKKSITIRASLYSFTDTYYQNQLHTSLDISQSEIDSSILSHYDMSNYTMEVNIDGRQLRQTLNSGKTYSYIDKSGSTHSYTVQSGDTLGTVLEKLDLLTSDNKVDITNIEGRADSIDNAFLTDLLGVDFSRPSNSPQVTIKFNAKTGVDAPPEIKDRLVNYSVHDFSSDHLITTGYLAIKIDDGDPHTLNIDENTTVQDFKEFMAGIGFTYDPASKNFINSSAQANKEIKVSGSSTITGMLQPVIKEYLYNVGIADDNSVNYYKNLSVLGLTKDTTISINEVDIDVKKSWSVQDLSDAINNAKIGIQASIYKNTFDINSDITLKLTRTDKKLSYIDITTKEDDDSGINELLKNIGLFNERNEIDKTKQTLPDSVSVTIKDQQGKKVYGVGEISSSDIVDGIKFSTIVKNMSANDSNVMLGSFNIDIFKLGESRVTINDATAAVPDITVSNLSGATNIIEMVEKNGTLSSNNYNLTIKKISDNKMEISGTDKDGNPLEPKTIEKDSDNKFYYTIEHYDDEGNEKGSVKFEIKNDDDFYIGDTRTTNIKIEATTSEGGSLDGIEDVINSVNAQIDENNKKIINEFVAAYNDVSEQVSKINKLSGTSTSYADKSTINELVKGFNNIINQVDTTYGSTIGLTFGYDSSLNTSILKLDSDKFLTALDENTETVTNYLSKVSNQITSSIDLFVKGKFASIYSSSNLKLDEYNSKISSLKEKNDKLMAKLEADYKIIEQMFNQSSNQYSELFAALS